MAAEQLTQDDADMAFGLMAWAVLQQEGYVDGGEVVDLEGVCALHMRCAAQGLRPQPGVEVAMCVQLLAEGGVSVTYEQVALLLEHARAGIVAREGQQR